MQQMWEAGRESYSESLVDDAQEHDQRKEEHGNDLQRKADVQLELPETAERSPIIVPPWLPHVLLSHMSLYPHHRLPCGA